VKYADGLVRLAKEEMVLQGMTDRLIEIAGLYGMKMNVENYCKKNLKTTTPITDYDR
jgi:hypothetical protein